MNEVENQINDLEQKEPENNNAEQQEENKKKMRRVINSLWDNFKRSNICLIWGASRLSLIHI